MEFQDKVLKCIDCGAEFVFTAGEQLFFHDKQFKNEPKRCKPCKAKRASMLGVATPGTYPKVETRTVCSNCGKETMCRSSRRREGRCSAASASSRSAPRWRRLLRRGINRSLAQGTPTRLRARADVCPGARLTGKTKRTMRSCV
jgi:DNA-directed RNA polymerase subunit RPC12/RpoP